MAITVLPPSHHPQLLTDSAPRALRRKLFFGDLLQLLLVGVGQELQNLFEEHLGQVLSVMLVVSASYAGKELDFMFQFMCFKRALP